MEFIAAPAGTQVPEVRVFITAGERAGQYAHAVELTQQGFVTIRVREGGHIVVDPRDLRRA